MVLTVLPHALLELTAVFLPLAAWTIASRRGDWQDLMAATVATVAMAIPMLLIAAAWETWVWPHLIDLASPPTSSFPAEGDLREFHPAACGGERMGA